MRSDISSRGKVWVGKDGFLSSMDGTKIKNFSSNVDSIRIFGTTLAYMP